MNPKQFLLVSGLALVLLGVLGLVGLIGPTAERSIFGEAWWFDSGENWAHLILGVAGLLALKVLSDGAQRTLVLLLGILGVLVGVWGFFSTDFLGANLENPADNLLHLVVGAWALWASRRGTMAQAPQM